MITTGFFGKISLQTTANLLELWTGQEKIDN